MARPFYPAAEARKLRSRMMGTGMWRPPLILAALLLTAACATAPEPEPVSEEVVGLTDRYGPLIEAQANEIVAAEPAGVLPEGLQITVLSVEETEAGLFYSAELHVAAPRRRDQEYVIYGQCQPGDLVTCARQLVAGARMLTKPGG